MDQRITNEALMVISHQLYTIELMLADALSDNMHLTFSSKSLDKDHKMIESLSSIMQLSKEVRKENHEN